MLGVIFVPAFFIAVIVACLTRPPVGVAGFYCFYILDPKWNWRWAVPQDIDFQKYIFAALVTGIILQGFRIPTQAKPCRRGLILGFAFLAICSISANRSISPTISQQFNDVLWKQLIVVAIGILIVRTRKQITWSSRPWLPSRTTRTKSILTISRLALHVTCIQSGARMASTTTLFH